MAAQCVPHPEMSASISLQARARPVVLRQAAGRTIHFDCSADLVPGALIPMHLRRGDRSAQILVEVQHATEGEGTRSYQARIVNTILPEWLFHQLDTRRAFRVDVAADSQIVVKLTLGGQPLRGVLKDASQDGLAVLCNVRLEVASQLGVHGSLELEIPEGRVQFVARLRRLKGVGERSRMGIEFVDDGSLLHRRSRSTLRSYVMRRQREIAQSRVEVSL